MPFAGYVNFDACVADQVSNGKSPEAARRICGALQARVEGRKSSTRPGSRWMWQRIQGLMDDGQEFVTAVEEVSRELDTHVSQLRGKYPNLSDATIKGLIDDFGVDGL